MKLIKKILAFFSPIEVIVLLSALTISTFLVIPAFTHKPETQNPQIGQRIVADEYVYNVDGGIPVPLFDTQFLLVYEESSESFKQELINTMNELLVPHHKLFDRHNYYYAVNPVNPASPTSEEKANLPRLHNLKYLNDHKGERIEIEKPLYDLLIAGKEYTLNTPQNAFNMFIGDLYDFWSPHTKKLMPSKDPLNNEVERLKLERLQSYIPQTAEDINNTLVLETVGDKYFATFNEFNNSGNELSISVGAIGKGLMTDMLADAFIAKDYTKGYIFGGGSSITFLGRGFYGSDFPIKLENINIESRSEFTMRFARSDQYQMSTSGIYMGQRFMHEGEEIIRSHIIDPLTGYPVQRAHHAVNITSATLSSLELDYLTTALTVLPLNEGVNLIGANYRDHEVNLAYIGVDENGWFIHKNRTYPGQNTTLFEQNSEYREIFLDFL